MRTIFADSDVVDQSADAVVLSEQMMIVIHASSPV